MVRQDPADDRRRCGLCPSPLSILFYPFFSFRRYFVVAQTESRGEGEDEWQTAFVFHPVCSCSFFAIAAVTARFTLRAAKKEKAEELNSLLLYKPLLLGTRWTLP